MKIALILAALVAAFWSAWRSGLARVTTLESAAPLVLVTLVVAVPAVIALARKQQMYEPPLGVLCGLLAAYAATCFLAPPIIQIALAVIAVLFALYWMGAGASPPLAFYGLVCLALPIVPTMEFYLSHPLRLACAGLTAALLQSNGLAVGVEGVALQWAGQSILFDAPCSGVHMLWASLFLGCAIGYFERFNVARLALTFAIALTLTIVGNAVRAASLFYLEAGIVETADPKLMHEAVGLVTFALTALALAVAVKAPWRSMRL